MSSLTSPRAPTRRSTGRHLLALWALLSATIVFLVAFEQGALSAGTPLLHEAFHDARHLIGVPCH